jgi:hypothetical protein
MIAVDEFLSFVLPDCPGCSDAGALSAINSALIEFCEKSLVLQRDADPINVKADRADYDLDAPTGYLVCKVMKAWFNNRVLTPTGPDDMDDPGIYNPNVNANRGVPVNFIQKDERSISLWPIPAIDDDKALTLRLALKPSRLNSSVDDVLFEDWVDVIGAGAKSGLQMTPGKPFSNPAAAMMNANLFRAGINRALMKGYKGHTRADLSVRMRRL